MQEISSDYPQKKMSQMDILFSFHGRIGRSTYWLRGLLPIYFFAMPIVYLFDDLIGAEEVLFSIFAIFLIWPILALNVKRWHDRGKSGFWVFISLIPLIGALWHFIETGFLKGDIGPNQFGEEAF